jgi:hypothetical protein
MADDSSGEPRVEPLVEDALPGCVIAHSMTKREDEHERLR